MKTKERKNKRKGISLIVLVITIIVIIILALAVILSINKNNPIENARVAKEKNNEKVYQEELELYVANALVNNHEYNRDTLNAFNVKKVITSIAPEDEEKYIVWQGKLAKKDGNIYKYLNGNDIKMFGKLDANGVLQEQENLTVNKVQFAKEFERIQDERIKNGESPLIYNGGYITNCLGDTPQTIKEKLSEKFELTIKNYDLTSIKGDTFRLGTDDGIYCNIDGNEELVARIVVFGDVQLTDLLLINGNDSALLAVIVKNKKDYTIGQYLASDMDGNGTLTEADYKYLDENWPNYMSTINQNRPVIIPKF